FRVLSSEFLAATGVDAAFDGPLSLVAWTTTPWTLPANVALAVNPEAEYGLYEHEGEHYVVAAALAEKVLGERASHVASFPGTALVGLKYEPLYRPELLGQPVMRFDSEGHLRPITGSTGEVDRATDGLRRVIAADYVSLDDGTGIVHNATSFGGEDFEEGKSHRLLFVQPVDLRGIM